MRRAFGLIFGLLVACGDGPELEGTLVPKQKDASVTIDSGVPLQVEDAGMEPVDLGTMGEPDLGTMIVDAGTIDAGTVDAGTFDAGMATIDAGTMDAGTMDAGFEEPPVEDGPTGFIGGPCATDDDCSFMGGRCITGGAFARGTCTQLCDRFCPDQTGYPVTYCAAAGDLPVEAQLGDGSCLSRCDYGQFPQTGCRPDYGCRTVHRANEPTSTQQVCLPGPGETPPDCYGELAAMGVDFEPTMMSDTHPSGHPELTCHVEDPVIIHPPIHGVDVRYYDDSPTPNMRAACNMAKALSKTIDDVKSFDVVKVLHIGTYNCRLIAGSSSLSRHAHADAIDLYGFVFANGDRYTLIDDWEHETTMPMTPAGLWLYDTAHRWHSERIWNIILTPNYNAAHDNHFHVDLTPGSNYLGFQGWGFIGPAPYDD